MAYSPGSSQPRWSGGRVASDREKDYVELAAMFRRQGASPPEEKDLKAMSEALHGGRFDHFLAAVLDARFPGRRNLDPETGVKMPKTPTLGDYFRNMRIGFKGLRESTPGETLDLDSRASTRDETDSSDSWEFAGERYRFAFSQPDFETCLRHILSVACSARTSTTKVQVPRLFKPVPSDSPSPDSASEFIAKSTLKDYFQALHIAVNQSVVDSEHDTEHSSVAEGVDEQFSRTIMDENGNYAEPYSWKVMEENGSYDEQYSRKVMEGNGRYDEPYSWKGMEEDCSYDDVNETDLAHEVDWDSVEWEAECS